MHPVFPTRQSRIALMAAALAMSPSSLLAKDTAHDHAAEGHAHREHGVHVHGEGQLTLALSGKQLDIALVLPADSAFGFEHFPGTEADQQIVNTTLATLKDPGRWISEVSDLGCTLTDRTLDEPFQDVDRQHVDVTGQWTMTCSTLTEAPTLTITLFKQFERLKQLEVEFVTDAGAGQKTLSADDHRVTLK